MEEVLQIVCNWKFQVSHRMEFLEPILVVHMMAECSRNRKIVQNNKSVVCDKSSCLIITKAKIFFFPILQLKLVLDLTFLF